jgi:hypothetical protein
LDVEFDGLGNGVSVGIVLVSEEAIELLEEVGAEDQL